ncbi:hypothetical protein T266_32000 [Pseudomonas aeruginosa VRFPA05]|nr:hypothetical protein T266_32000 [Pseudomonas aeruginosa VRFPA05]ETD95025.1 hypothetical protein V527_01070 [Pseudomonas aeruginosa VRFPA06]KFB16674.1 hypothetical protein PGPR2_01735 [Pseudomonas aeruginosa PGPR2]
MLRHILMGVEDNLLTLLFQSKTNRYQFGIMKMIDISPKRQSLFINFSGGF